MVRWMSSLLVLGAQTGNALADLETHAEDAGCPLTLFNRKRELFGRRPAREGPPLARRGSIPVRIPGAEAARLTSQVPPGRGGCRSVRQTT